MARKDVRKGILMTLTESYPTLEAYESGLLVPSSTRPGAFPRYNMHMTPDFEVMAPEWDQPTPCHASPEGNGQPCEFRDFCNHLYTVDLMCDCEVAWKKRAGLALPTSA